jgi:hypothetical protein
MFVLALADQGEVVAKRLAVFDQWAEAEFCKRPILISSDQREMLQAVSALEPLSWWGVYGIIS